MNGQTTLAARVLPERLNTGKTVDVKTREVFRFD